MSSTTENKYVSNGSTVLYSFTFPYINEIDVKVSFNGLDTTAYTLANATTVELDSAPNSGVSIRIYRDTPTDSITSTFFPGSAIRAQDLNDNFEQALYVVQESQTIIENSDAASVTAIANEALATANQANNTANAVGGTANQALTEAGEADTTANQALSDAETANDVAVAARTVADAALNSGSVISDLFDVSATAPTTEQVLAWSGSQWRPVDQTGGGGTGPTRTNIYGTAKAAGTVASSGIKANGFGFTSQLLSAGNYLITFDTPRTNINYSVTGSAYYNNTGFRTRINISTKTNDGFRLVTFQENVNNSSTPVSFDFAVHDDEPVAVGGTMSGAAAWGAVAADGTLEGGLNATVVKPAGNGGYNISFTTPMPTSNYGVTLAPAGTQTIVRYQSRTVNGFYVTCRDVSVNGVAKDSGFSFAVNATDATLPPTFTEAQIQSVIDLAASGVTSNSVPRLYGSIQGTGSVTLLNSYDTLSVDWVSSGTYRVNFNALPSANYCVQLTSEAGGGNGAKGPYIDAQTTTSFIIYTYNESGSLADNPLINYVLYQNQD